MLAAAILAHGTLVAVFNGGRECLLQGQGACTQRESVLPKHTALRLPHHCILPGYCFSIFPTDIFVY